METGFTLTPPGTRATFAGVPAATVEALQPGAVAILGAPFDWGTTNRPGARFGPRAIRAADHLAPDGIRPNIDTGIDPLQDLGVVDLGDVDVVPGYTELSLQRITDAVEAVARREALPVVLGGDHTITFATATGVARVHGFGNVALVHFDAHADTGESHFGELYGHGTPMRRLVESGAIPGHRFVQIGLRGYWPRPDVLAWMRERQMRTFSMRRIREEGFDAVLDEAVGHAADGADAVFVSLDIDVVDPGMAPATGTPEPGGLDSTSLLAGLERIGRELPVIGADLVEVSPPYDGPGEITARLAHVAVLELLHGMAAGRLG